MNIRRIGKGTVAFLVLLAGVLASCFSPFTGTETLGRFVIGGSSSRAFFDNADPDDIALLSLDITVSGGPGPEQRKTGERGQAVPFTVKPGTWTITVRANFNGNFAAYGSATADITAGDNTVKIDMHTIEAGLYQIDGEVYTRVDDVARNDVGAAVDHVNTNAGTYILFMQSSLDVPAPSQTLNAGGHLTLMGITGEGTTTATTIQLSESGTLFIVQDGASLTLGSAITLTGATNSAVRVDTGGTFTMLGGTISGNTAAQGGGVYVAAGGTFSKTGGEISDNNATAGAGSGDAVYVDVDDANYKFRDTNAEDDDNSTDADFWEGPLYTVTFEANGATSGDTSSKTVVSGNSVTLPTVSKDGNTFDGWYEDASFTGNPLPQQYTPTTNVTLYAKWESAPIVNALAPALDIDSNVNGTLDSTLSLDVSVSNESDITEQGGTLTYQWYSNAANSNTGGTAIDGETLALYSPPTDEAGTFYYYVTVTNTLTGDNDGGIKTAVATSNVVTVTVENSSPYFPNDAGLYRVTTNPTMYTQVSDVTLNDLSSAFTKLTSAGSYLLLFDDDGTVTGEKRLSTAGITLTIQGLESERIISFSGGGIVITGNNTHLILKENITLQGNTNINSALVRLEYFNAQLTMETGSTIKGNTNNDTTENGGGVAVIAGIFIMNNGAISGNTASLYGGGVYVENGKFTMNDGYISGNTAQTGGGVYVETDGTFSKGSSGGTIYGESEDPPDANTCSTQHGAAVYVCGIGTSSYWYRDTNAHYDEPLNNGDTHTGLIPGP